jgi:hypothetical protein
MLLSMVPASDSILPREPNGNLALQPGHQSRVYSDIRPSQPRLDIGIGGAVVKPSRVPAPVLCLSAKQEAKMNWVKCTDMNKQPIYVNIENATSIRWDEKEKSCIIAFAVTGGDTIEVIEEPDAIIRGQ